MWEDRRVERGDDDREREIDMFNMRENMCLYNIRECWGGNNNSTITNFIINFHLITIILIF